MSDEALSQIIWCYNKHVHGKKHEISWGQSGAKETLPHPANGSATINLFCCICSSLVHELKQLYICRFSSTYAQDIENWSHQVGKRKKVWKNVLMSSMSSCRISASPKRKNALWRFLSCGQRVFHAARKSDIESNVMHFTNDLKY